MRVYLDIGIGLVRAFQDASVRYDRAKMFLQQAGHQVSHGSRTRLRGAPGKEAAQLQPPNVWSSRSACLLHTSVNAGAP